MKSHEFFFFKRLWVITNSDDENDEWVPATGLRALYNKLCEVTQILFFCAAVWVITANSDDERWMSRYARAGCFARTLHHDEKYKLCELTRIHFFCAGVWVITDDDDNEWVLYAGKNTNFVNSQEFIFLRGCVGYNLWWWWLWMSSLCRKNTNFVNSQALSATVLRQYRARRAMHCRK